VFYFKGNQDNAESSNPTSEIQQTQPVFPSSIASGVICLIDLLFDNELISTNQSSNEGSTAIFI